MPIGLFGHAAPFSRPCLEFQSVDTLKFAEVVSHQREVVGQSVAGDKKVIWANHHSSLFQIRPDKGGRFRGGTVKRQFDDHRQEPINLLPFPGRILRLLNTPHSSS